MSLALNASGTGSSASSSTMSVSATTTVANCILVLCAGAVNNASSSPVGISTVTTSGLTWTKRKIQVVPNNNGKGTQQEIWWALAPTAGAYTASITYAASIDSAACVMHAISGANTTSPFDLSPVLPALGTACVGTPLYPAPPITTYAPNTFLLAFFAGLPQNVPTTALGSGWTHGSNANSGGGAQQCGVETFYSIVSSLQTNFCSLGTSGVSGNPDGCICDAIVAASQTSLTALPNVVVDGLAVACGSNATTEVAYISTQNPTGGYLFACVEATGQSNAPTATAVTDSNGNTWTSLATVTVSTHIRMQVFYLKITAAQTNLAVTLTPTVSGSLIGAHITVFGVAAPKTFALDAASPFINSATTTTDATISGISTNDAVGALFIFATGRNGSLVGPSWTSYTPMSGTYNSSDPGETGVTVDNFTSGLSGFSPGNSATSYATWGVIAFALSYNNAQPGQISVTVHIS
jgi:hypothetical protein